MKNWGMCFTPIVFIGGKIYSNNPKNMNNVHKDSNELVSVIINMVTNIRGGDKLLYDRLK